MSDSVRYVPIHRSGGGAYLCERCNTYHTPDMCPMKDDESVDPLTLYVTHIYDGQEVVRGGEDGQVWVATFASPLAAEMFVSSCRLSGFRPVGERPHA